MKYKGFTVKEEQVNDHETALVIDAPCGCYRCQREGYVLPGHLCCSVAPKSLVDDPNVDARLEGSTWFWEYFEEDK